MHTTRFLSQAKSRPTIGLITARLKGPTEINLWHGIEDRAQECDVNLICFSGGIPKWPYEYEAQKNILFKIAGPQNLNGLLIWSNILGHTLDREEIELFCSKYAPLPVINMGISLDTIPSIFFDMREGMRNLMAHLFEKHACQRIAFIRGLEVSQDAEERFQAYMDSLEAYGIPFDPQLVQPGDFRRPSAYAATERLLDLFGTSIDAIVSANDNMAIGVVQSLQKQGIRVPEDIIVVGFDDIEETIAISPSLTTVRTPWYEMGSKSVDMLLARLKGEPSPEPIKLQTELILGQSCGCRSLPVIQYPLVFRPFAEKAPKDTQNLELVCNSLIEEIRRKVASTDAIRGLHKDWPTILVNSFLTDVYGKESLTFLTTLENYLNAIIYGAEIMEWRDVIGSIQIHLLPVFTTEEDILYAIELMQRAHHLIGDIAHRKQLQQRLAAEEQADRLNHIIQAMSAIHEIDQLMELLAHELPDLGINTCFLSLYEGEGNPPELSRLIMASNSQGRVPLDEGGELFHTKNLVPANLLPPHRRYSFDVEALFFREEQMGFVVLELGSRNGDVYTALRGHISSVLKSAQLVQKIKDAEARAVKADQLKTRLLANVSHELRAPLNIIVGFSQTAMSTPNPYGIDLPDLLLHDLTHIYTSGEHLIRMINDLLDTSRAEIDELDLWMEYIDTRSFLEETYSSFASKGRMKKNAIEWIVDIPENIPVLYADPARLRQILNNLMSNAEKFTDAGQIVLGARVQVPHLHLWVADTGFGIPVDQQEQIFEPFIKINKSDRRYEGLGLGLSITRRLVALHGGSMTLDSRTGHGSTFHVYLPLPNLAGQTIQVFDKENVQPILLCLSTIAEPGAAIEDLCISNGYKLLRIRAKDDLNTVLRGGKPAALAWDMTHAMPADWSVIQTLRNHPQICQLPFLLFNREKSGGLVGTTQITEVLLKPVNKSILSDMIASFCPEKFSGSILVVDDDDHALAHYTNLINDNFPGYTVVPAQGGASALEILNSSTPDLVLLDLMMPEVDGFSVLTYIRSSPETTSVPVIVLSGRVITYEDVQKLNYPQVVYQKKGILNSGETIEELNKILDRIELLPQQKSHLVRNSLVFLHENYSRTITLTEVAASIGASKSYISRIFRAEMGITLWEYLKRFRIQKAEELLTHTGYNITEIATQVGFDDIGYFSRVFHKVAGCPPREYRQKTRS